jgi:hypothetical protein
LYIRHFRGTPVGDAVRSVWYWFRRVFFAVKNWRINPRQRLAWDWRRRFPSAWEFQYRATYVVGYYWPRLRTGISWLSNSRETSNFTYDLTQRNMEHLAELLAVVLRMPAADIAGYIRELGDDQALKETIVARVKLRGTHGGYDPVARFGRRIGWYALVRATKPRLVVETGVEKGLGAMVLCAALMRNAQEGFDGRYLGTDIDPGAGGLFCGPYNAMGKILYGDSIESLSGLDATIDLFINDSDHSAEYEGREYRVVGPKLAERAIIIGDNAHVTDELLKYSRETGRQFLFFSEEPAKHWYLGAGIGLSYRPVVERRKGSAVE